MTLESRVLQVLFKNVTVLNGEETEEDLNMLISEKIVQNNLDEIKKNLVVEQLSSEMDTEKLEDTGVFIYKYESLDNWKFTKHNTIADAVRAAIKDINVTIIYKGEVVTYDTLDSKSAYYIDNSCNKIKIVNL